MNLQSMGELVAFHTRMKLSVMAHSPTAYRTLGRMVAHGAREDFDALVACYQDGLRAALAIEPTRGRHANVLSHAFGYVSDALTADERREVVDLIEQYRLGAVEFDAPLQRLGALIRSQNVSYLQGQHYFAEAMR